MRYVGRMRRLPSGPFTTVADSQANAALAREIFGIDNVVLTEAHGFWVELLDILSLEHLNLLDVWTENNGRVSKDR